MIDRKDFTARMLLAALCITGNIVGLSIPSRMVGIDSLGRIAAAGRSFDGSTFNMAVVRYLSNGQIDAPFGTINGTGHFFSGMTTIDFRSSEDRASSLVIDPLDRISVAGFAGIPTINPATLIAEVHNAFALARLLPNGDFDPSFNPLSAFSASRPGTVITIIAQTSEANGVILDSSGKLVAAGFSNISEEESDNFTLARYNPDGSLDSTFGTGGVVITEFDADSIIYGITQDAAGKYVVVGTVDNDFLTIARYNTDGSLDATLDPTGDFPGTVQVDVVDPETGEHLATTGYSVIIDNSNRILTAGVGYAGTSAHLVLVRFNADGSFDDSFGDDAIQLVPITSANVIIDALAIDASDHIIVSALSRNLDGSNTNLADPFTVFRLDPDGFPDTSFTPHNVTVVASDQEQIDNEISVANSVLIDSLGRILVAGFYLQSRNQNIMVLARYLPTGAFDATFNATGPRPGVVVTNLFFGPSTPSRLLQIGLLGSIFVSKTSFNGANFDMAIAKYTSDGTPDIFWGRPELVPLFIEIFGTGLSDLTLLNALFAAISGRSVQLSPLLQAQVTAFITQRDTLSASQPVPGVVSVDILGGNDVANALIIDQNNNIVAAGYASVPDLSLTTTIVTNVANDILITPTNEIVQSATSDILTGAAVIDIETTTTERRQFALIRLLPNGTLDEDFEPTDDDENESNKPGTIVTEIEFTSEANAIILDINNNYVLAGFSNEGGDEFDNVTLARYLPNGSLDKTFGPAGDGIVISELEDDTVAYGLTEDFDNKLIITGSVNTERILVARYLPSGVLDGTFNATGEIPGTVVTPISGFFAEGYTVLVDRSNRIMVAGVAQNALEANLVVLRYLPNGVLDPSFGAGGIRLIPVPYFNVIIDSLAVDQQDRIVVTATSRNTDVTLKSAFNFAEPFVVIRLNTDGTDDLSFNKHGFIPLPEAGLPPVPQKNGIGNDEFTMVDNAVVIDADDKILVAGFFNETRKRNNILLARYLTNGDFDPTFNPFGQVVDRLINTGATESSTLLPPGVVLTNTFFDNQPTAPGGSASPPETVKIHTPTEAALAKQKAAGERVAAISNIPIIDFPEKDFIVDTKTPKITGTARPSSFISITLDNRIVSFMPTDSLGNWEYTATLADGKHTVMVSNLDYRGKAIQDSVPVQFTVSLEPLRAPIITNPRPNATVKAGTVEITGTASRDVLVPIFIDNMLVATSKSNASGNWTYSAALKDGKHTVYAATSDGISKMSPYTPTISFEVNAGTNRPPVITSPTHNITARSGKVVFTGTGSGAHTIVLMLNEKEIAQINTNAQGDWEHTVFLGNGKYTAFAYQLDKLNNKSKPSSTITFTIDKRKRAAPAQAAVPAVVTEDAPVRGRSVPDAQITILIDEKPVKKISADESGHWSFIFEIKKLAKGEHTIGILSNDKKKNRSWLSTQKIIIE